MSSGEHGSPSHSLLSERVAQAPDFVARVPRTYPQLFDHPDRLPRCLVSTGIGTSAGHARHFAEAAARWLGQPARFASTASLAAGAPPGSDQDWLVAFSQGLSANARYALRDVERWGGVLLVTGLPSVNASSLRELGEEKLVWRDGLRDRGVIEIDLGCGTEYGSLLRVIGARVGYSVGWSILRSIGQRQLRTIDGLECDADRLREAQILAPEEVRRVFPRGRAIGPFFDPDQSLLIMAEGGLLEFADQLALKVAEGMLRPRPACVDVLDFAHGPLQSIADRKASILYLGDANSDWFASLRATLDPNLHDVRTLRGRLQEPFSILEFEAMFDELVLRVVAEQSLDLSTWPGQDREAALYSRSPEPLSPLPSGLTEGGGERTVCLEDAVWPEISTALSAGCRDAILGLGSIEQHGPHLPLGTDHWISQALVEGLARRIEGAVALPSIPFGCAREHLDFPGTLSVEPQTLKLLLGDVVESLKQHGFERVFVWTAHGGNVDALNAMREELTRRAAPLVIAIETDLPLVARMQSQAVASEGLDPDHAGPHAGEFETSLVASLRPGSVRLGKLASGRVAPRREAQDFFYPSLRDSAPTGVVGDPSQASADRGMRYFNAWLDLLEAAYRGAFAGGSE